MKQTKAELNQLMLSFIKSLEEKSMYSSSIISVEKIDIIDWDGEEGYIGDYIVDCKKQTLNSYSFQNHVTRQCVVRKSAFDNFIEKNELIKWLI